MRTSQRRIISIPALLLLCLFATSSQAQPYVCVESSLGDFCIELFEDTAPATVANFLTYVNGGDYDGTFIHRSVPGFIIQGGGYFYTDATDTADEVPSDAPVVNEFSRSNVRGTIAMAKLGTDPNSATNEWFINLDNNSGSPAFLDTQNGGFTVFGQVVGNGMVVVDAIASRTVTNLSSLLGGAFSEVPRLKFDNNLTSDDLITLNRLYETDADNLPDDAEFPTTTGIFNGNNFAVPVHYQGKLYRFIFDLTSTAPNYSVFRPRMHQVVQLTDVGQDAGVYTKGTLTIPSITFGNKVYSNLVFKLTHVANLEFTLQSFDSP